MIDYEQKKRDIIFGKGQEKKLIPLLRDYFDADLIETDKTRGLYCKWDFEDREKKIMVELKSRRIKHNDFPTALLDYHKLVPAKKYLKKNPLGEWWFCFNYTDGIYYVDYEDIKELKGKTMKLKRGDTPFNIEIPIERLTKLEQGYCIERIIE